MSGWVALAVAASVLAVAGMREWVRWRGRRWRGRGPHGED